LDLLEIAREDVGGHLLGPNEVLKLSQEIVVLRFKRSTEDETLYRDLIGKLPRVMFRIRYESMYKEKYELLGNG
jgi:hypothetical protein